MNDDSDDKNSFGYQAGQLIANAVNKQINFVANRNTNPVGSISLYAGEKAPKLHMFCDGREVSREKYAALFEVIGVTFGEGDGNTTFNIPNIPDFVAGKIRYIIRHKIYQLKVDPE